MEKINQKFLKRLHFTWGPKPASGVVAMCANLKVGEMIFISKKEWKAKGYKTKPRARIENKLISTKKCEEGWVLTRIK